MDVEAIQKEAINETLLLILFSTTDIAAGLMEIGDCSGANSLCVLIRTIEEHA